MNATDNNNAKTYAAVFCCARCGVAELDEIKLTYCDGCGASYCNVGCQQLHLLEWHETKHEEICKKQAADEILFRQPESSYLGDCPTCFLPIPLDINKSTVYTCCCKRICDGCVFAQEEEGLDETCPFCRKEVPETDEENINNVMERVAVNDPVALREMGAKHYNKGDNENAFEYFTRAAKMGDAAAHFDISLTIMYFKGLGVEIEKDKERKRYYHLEEAAIAGHPKARYNLGIHECTKKQYERAVKHFIIAANLGHDKSLTELKKCYIDGHISKVDFAAALRAHQAAKDAMKSPQREAAAAAAAESH